MSNILKKLFFSFVYNFLDSHYYRYFVLLAWYFTQSHDREFELYIGYY